MLTTESTQAESSKSNNKKSPFVKDFLEQLEKVIFAFVAVIFIFTFFGRACVVDGTSMDATLHDGETVIISNFMYKPERNDIVIFHQTEDLNKQQDELLNKPLNEPIVKRVIGLPGETVKIQHYYDRMVVIIVDGNGNETTLDEDYIQYSGNFQNYEDIEIKVEEGTVFVLGDNRSVSIDSRAENIGLVDQRRILGKVVFRIAPFSRMGTVK